MFLVFLVFFSCFSFFSYFEIYKIYEIYEQQNGTYKGNTFGADWTKNKKYSKASKHLKIISVASNILISTQLMLAEGLSFLSD